VVDGVSHNEHSQKLSSTDWLVGGGTMGDFVRAKDWSETPLGPLFGWPQSLRSAISICLGSRFPIVIYWGAEFVVLYNDAYAQILGSKHPRALGRRCRDVWAEIWDVIEPMLQGVVATGEATWSDNQLLVLKRHGFPEECYFSFSFSPIRSEDDRVGGVFTAVIEHTQRIVGERRLVALRDLGSRSMEAKTAEEACAIAAKSLCDHAKDIPFALLYLINGNEQLARLAGAAGVARDDAISPPLLRFSPGTADRQPWSLIEVVHTNVMQLVEDLACRFGNAVPPGPWSDPPRQAVVVPIRSNISRELAGILVAGVSARLELDELYRSFYELVASQIATAIANASAHEAEHKRAEALAEIDRAKTAFFSNVSHEFRTPLTLMLGPLEDALASSALPSGERDRLTVAHRNSLRLLKLVNTLLDFSRIEAGRVQAVYEPTDLAAVTAELASMFRSAVEKAGLSLVVDCPPLPEPAFIDPQMWEKIVLNLVSNAFKFTFQGEIEVRLRSTARHFELSVRDTGTGISAQELPKVFERFHRVAGANGRTHEGTGIGLALVQELVKLHGGSVSVESEHGNGSLFKVALPIGCSHLPAEKIGAKRTLPSTALGASHFVEEALRWLPEAGQVDERGIELIAPRQYQNAAPAERAHILVADDNADMRDYMRRLLASRYEVEVAADGGAALSAIACRKPDLVLSDIMMPRLDGMELVSRLRADPRTNTLPIILLSARAGEESRVEGMQAGADDYLIKPFSARELLARVEAHVKIARLRRDAEQALRDEQERWQLAAHVGRFGQWHLDLVTHAVDLSASCKAIFGLPPEKQASAEWLLSLIHADDRESVATRLKEAVETRTAYEVEYRVIWPDGSLHWINTRGSASYAPDGTALKMVGVTLDITERRGAEEHLRMLVAELDHRVKNVLATVSAVTSRTQEAAGSVADFVAALDGRIQSMAATHQLLSGHLWKGVHLSELVGRELAPYATSGNVEIGGPDITLKPEAGQALSMVLHELTTNAAKHGALSARGGCVAVRWCRLLNDDADAHLAIEWQETGGPLVQAPRRSGYGMEVIRGLLPYELGSKVDMAFASEGLQCRIEIPVRTAC
jgi:PAS domain S-box-containing protein